MQQACIVQSAGREVELAQLGSRLPTFAVNCVGKHRKDIVTEEVFVASQISQIGVREHCAELLKASGADFIQGNVELFQVWAHFETLCKHYHALVANYISFYVKNFQRSVFYKPLCDILYALNHELVELDTQHFKLL